MESLIAVDISPINTREVSDIQSVIDTLKSVDLNINGPISKVRKLADEQMKSSMEVCTIIILFFIGLNYKIILFVFISFVT